MQTFNYVPLSRTSYVGELPNSHGRTLTDKSYVLHAIPYKCLAKGTLHDCLLLTEMLHPPR